MPRTTLPRGCAARRMPLEVINPDIVANADGIQGRFVSNAPFPHVVLDDFFAPEFATRLLDEFPSFATGNYVGDDGRPGQKSTNPNIAHIGPAYAELDRIIATDEFLRLMARLTGVPELIFDPFYLGGGTHENRSGSSLDAHIDFNYHPSERWHRRLNLLLYLNTPWSATWGGSLELYADPRTDPAPQVCVTPSFNRCVIFETSERSWHGFDRVDLPAGVDAPTSRKSIALYFYTKERPLDQTAERHSTVYQHRPLPRHLVSGHALTDADVASLRELVGRRDAYIDQQHAEIRRLLQAQEHGLAGQVLYLMKRAYVRFRR